MNSKIEEYVNELFKDAPVGRRSDEIREELLANLNDKYIDLLNLGKNKDDAFNSVISSIGDIDGLLREFSIEPIENENRRKNRGLMISISTGLYIFAVAIMFLFLSFYRMEIVGITLFLAISAIATSLLIYSANVNSDKYQRNDNSFVEKYREKASGIDHRAKLHKAMSSSLWSMITLLYLLFSFWTWYWFFSWIIFIIGALIQLLITYAYSSPEKRKKLWHGIFWLATVTIYLFVSFISMEFSRTWMIFPMAVAVEQAIRLFILWGEGR